MARLPSEKPLVLGIETSCDDTACAVVDGGGRVIASVVSSQLAAHRPYGGVVPEIASREHLAHWPAVRGAALREAGLELSQIDVVAATRGPGLVGSLLVGLSLGRSIAFALSRPFHGVHHLEGHLFSPFLTLAGELPLELPEHFTGLVVSGGHTSLLRASRGEVRSFAETRDDAMGEVFDKVGKRLGLAYPQGPTVDLLAEQGRAERCPFKVKRVGEELFFSFSGLKSQALREIERLEQAGDLEPRAKGAPPIEPSSLPQPALDLLAGFRAAAVAQVLDRLRRLHDARPLHLLAVSGGAAANRLLRRELATWAEDAAIALRLVPLAYAGDNAAMIAWAALLRHRAGLAGDPLEAPEVASRLPFAAADLG